MGAIVHTQAPVGTASEVGLQSRIKSYKDEARRTVALGRSFVELDLPLGSTDMGNVSLVLPCIHPYIGIESWPAINHQPEFTACCARPSADSAVIDGAIAMAWTALDIASDVALRARLLNRA